MIINMPSIAGMPSINATSDKKDNIKMEIKPRTNMPSIAGIPSNSPTNDKKDDTKMEIKPRTNMPSVDNIPSIIIPTDKMKTKNTNSNSIENINLMTKELHNKDTPPVMNQIFNPKMTSSSKTDNMPTSYSQDVMKQAPKGKFNIQEVQKLETLYGKEGIKQSIDNNGHIDKNKFRTFLAENTLPPIPFSSTENKRNLFNIDV